MNSAAIAQAFLGACEAELAACKPGNVHIHAGGHGMTVDDFRASAMAAAPHLAGEGPGVGARVFSAVRASLDAAGLNTNLGILLLCAPLAHAALRLPPDETRRASLHHALRATLDALDQDDTAKVFAAIALANPGGLGEEPHDVRQPPDIGLREAMALAAGRDRIAAAYGDGFADIFRFGLAVLDSARACMAAPEEATSALYLAFLGEFPDSHIARKFGSAKAEAVRREARSVRADFHSVAAEDRLPLLMAFDRDLKERGFNPGTTADFTVATLFADALADALDSQQYGR